MSAETQTPGADQAADGARADDPSVSPVVDADAAPAFRLLLALAGVNLLLTFAHVGFLTWMSSVRLFDDHWSWDPRGIVRLVTPPIVLSSMPGLVWLIVERLRGRQGPFSPRAQAYIGWMLWFGVPSAIIWSLILIPGALLAFTKGWFFWWPPALSVVTAICMIPYANRRRSLTPSSST